MYPFMSGGSYLYKGVNPPRCEAPHSHQPLVSVISLYFLLQGNKGKDIQDTSKLWNSSILHSTMQLTGSAKENFFWGGQKVFMVAFKAGVSNHNQN